MAKKHKGETPTVKPQKILQIHNFKKTDAGELIQINKSKKVIKSQENDEMVDDEIENDDNHEEHRQVLICEHTLHDIFAENDHLQFELAKEYATRKLLERLLKSIFRESTKKS